MAYASRRPKLDLAALLTEQTPRIDLRLDDYERTTRAFVQRVTSFAERAAKEISARQAEFVAHQKKHAERAQKYEEQTSEAKARELELAGGASALFTPHARHVLMG